MHVCWPTFSWLCDAKRSIYYTCPWTRAHTYTDRVSDGQTGNVHGIVGTIIIDKHPTKKKKIFFYGSVNGMQNQSSEHLFFPFFCTFPNWLWRCGDGKNFDETSLFAQLRIIIITLDGRPLFEETQYSRIIFRLLNSIELCAILAEGGINHLHHIININAQWKWIAHAFFYVNAHWKHVLIAVCLQSMCFYDLCPTLCWRSNF